VLIVADATASCGELKSALVGRRDCEVFGPYGPLEALRFCRRRIPEVMLVHLQLADITAAEFAGIARGRGNGARIVIFFFGAPSNRRGVKPADAAAADGYIAPTEIDALPGRIAAAISAAGGTDETGRLDEYRGRHLEASFDRVYIAVDGVPVDLARRELALLQFLVANRNRILRREDILGHVWRNENDGRSRTVDVHIRRLRMKLGTAGKQIETVNSVGYRFSEL
jgi:DNA-binding response OmpR family regulator